MQIAFMLGLFGFDDFESLAEMAQHLMSDEIMEDQHQDDSAENDREDQDHIVLDLFHKRRRKIHIERNIGHIASHIVCTDDDMASRLRVRDLKRALCLDEDRRRLRGRLFINNTHFIMIHA